MKILFRMVSLPRRDLVTLLRRTWSICSGKGWSTSAVFPIYAYPEFTFSRSINFVNKILISESKVKGIKKCVCNELFAFSNKNTSDKNKLSCRFSTSLNRSKMKETTIYIKQAKISVFEYIETL